MQRKLSFLFFILLSLAGIEAAANMELSNVIFHFEPGDPARQDVEVFNPGDKPLYVEIIPSEVVNPGTPEERREVIKNPRDAGLLVTPNKLIVPPGASKMVRLVKLGNSPKERVYRVSAKPVIGGLDADQSGVKVMIGYELLAIVYPVVPEADLLVERTGRVLTVSNHGNANVLMREGFQCQQPEQPKDQCTPLPGRRIYPGNQWELELPYDLPVTYYQSVGSRNYVETYP